MVEEDGFLFLLVFKDGEIHGDPVSFEVVAGHHGLEVHPLRIDERFLNLIFEDDSIELVKKGSHLFIHNDQIFISYY